MNQEIKINENERKVLTILSEHYPSDTNVLYFKHIAHETGFDEKQVRRACRSLAKKGLAAYQRGLFDEDGMAAGSGYCATTEGNELINPKKEDHVE